MKLSTAKWVYLVGALLFLGGVSYTWHALLTSALSEHCAPLTNVAFTPLVKLTSDGAVSVDSDGAVSVDWKAAERLAAEGKVPGDWSHNLAAILLAVRDGKAKDSSSR